MSRKFLLNTRSIVVFRRNFRSNKNFWNMRRQNMRQRLLARSLLKNKMAEIYRCAVGPQLYRIFTKNSRQVSVEWTLFYLENTILPFGFRDLLAYIY